MSASEAPKRREKAADLAGGRAPKIGADDQSPDAGERERDDREAKQPQDRAGISPGLSDPEPSPRKKTTRRRSTPKKKSDAGDGVGPETNSASKQTPDQPAVNRRQPRAKTKQPTRRPAKPEVTQPKTGGAAEERPSRGGQRGRGPRRRSQPPPSATDRVMLVHDDPQGIQVAVLEEGDIVEHYVTRPEDRSIVGNVYLGKVQNVLPGMEASFVDIGEGRNGVLYAGEVGIAGDEGEDVPRIETVLRSGQPILVQVTKDPMKHKGARLTALVSIAGRHLVLVPNQKSLGVSRRLPDKERARLREIAQDIIPAKHGLIIRTAAEGASRRDLERDLERVVETWDEIEKKQRSAKAPALLYEEPELELRIIRDLFNREVQRCIVDDRALESKLRAYIRSTTPDLDHRLELYEGDLPIFEEYRVLEQIRKSLDRRVWLPSGGHLVIDRTEAMTVIDVNTGKFVGKSNLEETVFRTNKEAAVEVARQLRLRDIGGIIVIDFIDMEIAKNRDEVMKVFRAELERDRTRTQVFDITPLGLVQMTRKNVSAGIVETFSDPCPTCEGRGLLLHDVD
ncbi:MAG TPA: Rne/Rng family ribonuclease [Actinomycetota bacterium]|nr:Rne/Rng family ribonuclease [Actinomycetota bacterium]